MRRRSEVPTASTKMKKRPSITNLFRSNSSTRSSPRDSKTAASLVASPVVAPPPPPPPAAEVEEDYTVKVCVRKKPVKLGETDVVEVAGSDVYLMEQKQKVDLTKYTHRHEFKYDNAFGDDSNTQDIYDSSIRELVDNIFDGGTSTTFCFGQTASGERCCPRVSGRLRGPLTVAPHIQGKSFTLFGASGGMNSGSGEIDAKAAVEGGLYLMAAHDIFTRAVEQGLTVSRRRHHHRPVTSHRVNPSVAARSPSPCTRSTAGTCTTCWMGARRSHRWKTATASCSSSG
jgi:hypothetical protein